MAKNDDALKAALERFAVIADGVGGSNDRFVCGVCRGEGATRDNIIHAHTCLLCGVVPPADDAAGELPPLEGEALTDRATLYTGDSMVILRQMIAAGITFDGAAFDPPYHFESIVARFGSKTAKAAVDPEYDRVSRKWLGKNWDGGDLIFRPDFWRLLIQVLKPGAYVAAFSADKYYHRMGMAMEIAGFVPRHMMPWLYASGRLKAKDISKMVAKRYGEEAAKRFIGWATALKPSVEPVALFQKPLDGTYAHNALVHGVGGLDVISAGIPVSAEEDGDVDQTSLVSSALEIEPTAESASRRYPGNAFHDSSEEVERVFAQAGDTGARSAPLGGKGNFYKDLGNASRFFFGSKPAKSEKGDTEHPSVKPVNAMGWLEALILPKGGHVLDPFAGTGTTAVAALREGFKVTLIEREAEYAGDIRDRIGRISGADLPLFKL